MGVISQLWAAGRAGGYLRNKLCESGKKFSESWGSQRVPCQKEEERKEGSKQGRGCSGC